MRPRLAPIAARSAISLCRPDARASRPLATLAQAINSTKVTIAISASSVPRTFATTLSSSGWMVMSRRAFVCGNARASDAAIALISAWAWVSVTPAFRRAKTRSERPDRSVERAASDSGTHISARVCQNGAKRKLDGMTPSTVYGSPSSEIERPTIRGSAANRRCHSAWPSTTTRLRPGASSSSRNVRPAIGLTPRTWKRLVDTWSPAMRSGRSPSVSVAAHACAAPTASNERAAPR